MLVQNKNKNGSSYNLGDLTELVFSCVSLFFLILDIFLLENLGNTAETIHINLFQTKMFLSDTTCTTYST